MDLSTVGGRLSSKELVQSIRDTQSNKQAVVLVTGRLSWPIEVEIMNNLFGLEFDCVRCRLSDTEVCHIYMSTLAYYKPDELRSLATSLYNIRDGQGSQVQIGVFPTPTYVQGFGKHEDVYWVGYYEGVVK